MRVLISGAGVAGPTLAWFLAKAGARITVVEKSHALLPHGQNVDIQGSAVTIIQKMGLMDQIRQFNTSEKGTQFISSKGQPFAALPVKEGFAVSLTSPFEILRADLAAILYKATKDHSNVKYLFGTTIKEVVSNDDEKVQVELSNGEVHEYDLLVAADGQWSKLRKKYFPAEDIKAVYLGMYSIYYTVPRLPSDNDWWNIYIALGSRIITTRPDPHGTIRALFSLMPCNNAQETAWHEASRSDRETQGKLLRSHFADAGWQAERLLSAMDEAPDFYFHVMQQIKMSKWHRSRIICLGDAAYAPSPLTGMGTSLAIMGAYTLAGELSQLSTGENPSKAFEAYESKFRPLVEKSQEIPFFVPDFAHPRTAWKRWLLNSFFKVISTLVSIPWVAARLGDEVKDDKFDLPTYPRFENEASK